MKINDILHAALDVTAAVSLSRFAIIGIHSHPELTIWKADPDVAEEFICARCKHFRVPPKHEAWHLDSTPPVVMGRHCAAKFRLHHDAVFLKERAEEHPASMLRDACAEMEKRIERLRNNEPADEDIATSIWDKCPFEEDRQETRRKRLKAEGEGEDIDTETESERSEEEPEAEEDLDFVVSSHTSEEESGAEEEAENEEESDKGDLAEEKGDSDAASEAWADSIAYCTAEVIPRIQEICFPDRFFDDYAEKPDWSHYAVLSFGSPKSPSNEIVVRCISQREKGWKGPIPVDWLGRKECLVVFREHMHKTLHTFEHMHLDAILEHTGLCNFDAILELEDVSINNETLPGVVHAIHTIRRRTDGHVYVSNGYAAIALKLWGVFGVCILEAETKLSEQLLVVACGESRLEINMKEHDCLFYTPFPQDYAAPDSFHAIWDSPFNFAAVNFTVV